MSKDSGINLFKSRNFHRDESGIVWGMIVIAMTLIGSMLIFAVMGIVFDELYMTAHAENNAFNASAEGLETFDTMYGIVDYVPIVVLFSVFLFMLVRAILQEQY